jgi:hypothetical protein
LPRENFTPHYFNFMILYLFFQILISWLTASCIINLFNAAVSAPENKIYLEPTLLTGLFAIVDINLTLKTQLIAGKILHHTIGICFTAVYYLVWYYEFAEISWTTSFIIGLISGLIRIISWTFLVEIPSARFINFKGYYLQLVFVHNIFTITALGIYKLFVSSLN